MCTDKKKQYTFLHLTIVLAQINLDSRYWLSRESKRESDLRWIRKPYQWK